MGHSNAGESQHETKQKEAVLEDVVSNHEGVVISDEMNKRLVRKIDWRLMPVVRPLPPSFETHRHAELVICSPQILNAVQ